MVAMAYWWVDSDRGNVAGRWSSDFGTLKSWSNHQANELIGVYINTKTDQLDGLINGTLDGDLLSGYWIQQTSQRRCAEQTFETLFWGRLELSFDSDDAFSGRWGYCDDMVQRQWNGRKWISR
tara:strand:- start:280 stop:648 length:369 start_codon:yes stop_codon:yes gene_type:complete